MHMLIIFPLLEHVSWYYGIMHSTFLFATNLQEYPLLNTTPHHTTAALYKNNMQRENQHEKKFFRKKIGWDEWCGKRRSVAPYLNSWSKLSDFLARSWRFCCCDWAPPKAPQHNLYIFFYVRYTLYCG